MFVILVNMNQNNKLFIRCLVLFSLSSCCSDKNSNNDYSTIVKVNQLGYELELFGQRCVSGHDPLSILFSNKVRVFNYIYFPQRIGRFGSGKITLTYEKGKYEYPDAINNIRGSIEVSEMKVIIKLETPSYDDSGKVKSYQPYDFNGKYTIITQGSNQLDC